MCKPSLAVPVFPTPLPSFSVFFSTMSRSENLKCCVFKMPWGLQNTYFHGPFRNSKSAASEYGSLNDCWRWLSCKLSANYTWRYTNEGPCVLEYFLGKTCINVFSMYLLSQIYAPWGVHYRGELFVCVHCSILKTWDLVYFRCLINLCSRKKQCKW